MKLAIILQERLGKNPVFQCTTRAFRWFETIHHCYCSDVNLGIWNRIFNPKPCLQLSVFGEQVYRTPVLQL